MFEKLPPIKYKVHPKMLEIMQQKKKRKQILQKQRQKIRLQEQRTRKEKKQYFQISKQVIESKKQIIYEKKLNQRNKIRQQQKERQIRIEIKKSQRLAKLLPERIHLIQELKQSYIQYLTEKDKMKQLKIQQMFNMRLQEANKMYQKIVPLQVKIKQQNLIDINQGVCILCLSTEAQIFMVECKHLISCGDCEFILRMQKKCPVCRKMGSYKNINDGIKMKKKYKEK